MQRLVAHVSGEVALVAGGRDDGARDARETLRKLGEP